MRQVFILPHSRFNIHFSLMLDEAFVAHEAGSKVSVVYCDGSFGYCRTNICASKVVCSICRPLAIRAVKKLPSTINVYPLGQFVDKSLKETVKNLKFLYSSIEELKSIEYNGVDIGYSVLSFYVDLKRNLYPEFTTETIIFFDNLLRVAAGLSHVVENIDAQLFPDSYSVFNGRLFDARSFFRKPVSMKKQVKCFEMSSRAPSWENRSVCFDNALPHNIKVNAKNYRSFWLESLKNKSEHEMIAVSKSFYELRRANKHSSDKKVFSGNQVHGSLPKEWKDTNRNFVFFNSSEDEFAGIDAEFDSFKFLPRQIDVIKKVSDLASQIDTNIRIYLRIHPNLRNVEHSYHQDLQYLHGLNGNLTVISAGSPISTYTLIDKAEKVLVVGSTVGIEAVYSGKPVILLGPSFYRFLDACYLAENDTQLKELLEIRLEPRDRMGAYQYGFSNISIQGRAWKHFDFGGSGRTRFFGIRIPAATYYTFFGSSRLFGLVYKLFISNFLFISFNLKKYKLKRIGLTDNL